VSAATAIIPKPKHMQLFQQRHLPAQGGDKKRNNHIPANAVNKGSRNARALSELESNQAGLVETSREGLSALSQTGGSLADYHTAHRIHWQEFPDPTGCLAEKAIGN